MIMIIIVKPLLLTLSRAPPFCEPWKFASYEGGNFYILGALNFIYMSNVTYW